mgnify:CR=1 FL=1
MDKSALYKIGYGIYIVSSEKEGKYNAQTANTVFQITSDPPRVAVSINKSNLTWEYIKASGRFGVSVVAQDAPLKMIGRFGFRSGRELDKFEGISHKLSETMKLPVIMENTVGYFEAEVEGEYDAGTHTVFFGIVKDSFAISDAEPISYAYYHKVKKGNEPKTAPTFRAEEKNKGVNNG